MYYTTCGSGDFTNIDHMWLKTIRLQYSVHWRGTLPNFSHKQRESAETSEHFAKQERIELGPQVTQSHVIPTWCNGEAEFNKCMHKFVTVLDKYAKGMLVLLSWWIEVALKSGVLTIHTNHPGGNLVH